MAENSSIPTTTEPSPDGEAPHHVGLPSIHDLIKFNMRNSSDSKLKLEVGDPRDMLTRITNDIVPQAVDRYLSARNFYNVSPTMDIVTKEAINGTICHKYDIPTVTDYFAAMNVGGIAICSLGALLVITIFMLYLDTLRHIINHVPSIAKTNSIFVMTVYPVVATVTYCAIIVPRAQLLSEAVTQAMFMACLYQLFCLFVSYAGGESGLIQRAQNTVINMQLPPCCCYPCCSFLPKLEVNKRNLKLLRLLILQLPVVQGLVYLFLLVIWAEEQSLYQVNYLYFQPAVIVSLLLGIWGILMAIRWLIDVLPDCNLKGKFICLQLVLVFAKLQSVIVKICIGNDVFPCHPPMTSSVYGYLIYNSALLWQMMILCSLARMMYKKPLPEIYFTKPVQFPRNIVSVIDQLPKEGDLKNERTQEDQPVSSERDKF